MQRLRKNDPNYAKMLHNLIENTQKNKLYGDWNDGGRFLDFLSGCDV